MYSEMFGGLSKKKSGGCRFAYDEVADMDALDGACERNIPLEIFLSTGIGSSPVLRGRLLQRVHEFLYVERVRDQGGELNLPTGKPLECFFVFRDQIFGFSTEVARAHEYIQLNKRRRVPAVQLLTPQRIQQTQRRACYRVPLVGSEPRLRAELVFHEGMDPNVEDGWSSLLVSDASAHGAGLVIDEVLRPRDYENKHGFIRFRIPGETDLQYLRFVVRRISPLPAMGTTRLGLHFLPWPDEDGLERAVQPLSDYLTNFQRLRMGHVA